jgi:hypothetical protein
MINYIYLDDEPLNSVEPYIEAITDVTGGLRIKHFPPKAHSEQMHFLRQKEKTNEIDGLILDLRLDQIPNDNVRADYRAATLAQEIRTRATEGKFEEYPIILWSTDEKLSKSYIKDDTSHDLFDLKSVKGDMGDPHKAATFGKRLISLVEGYREIIQIRARTRTHVQRFLGFEEMPQFLDSRILAPIDARYGTLPAHEYARYLIRDLMETPGPLVDLDLLAARLGVDIQLSEDFLSVVGKLFIDAAYGGPFAKGWPRWWWSEVERIWKALPRSPGTLRNMEASAKVKFLISVSGKRGLVAAKPGRPSESSLFWTICRATRRPLDPRDGFLSDMQPTYTWQDRLYVSFSSLVSGEAKEKKIRIDTLESDRFNRAKRKP